MTINNSEINITLSTLIDRLRTSADFALVDFETGNVTNISTHDVADRLEAMARALNTAEFQAEAATILANKRYAEIERLKAQLPESMQECTIVFEKCEVGHGHLRGTNWIKHDCQQCKIDQLQAEIERYKGIEQQRDEFASRYYTLRMAVKNYVDILENDAYIHASLEYRTFKVMKGLLDGTP